VDLLLRGDTLFGAVVGTDWPPYRVRVRLDAANEDEPVAEAVCTCPYEWGGWCKHVVAVLFEAIGDPEAVAERPPLAETIAALKAPDLRALVLALADDHPALADEIETFAGLPRREIDLGEWDPEGW
jgi:uncharacterized Zn finger protein